MEIFTGFDCIACNPLILGSGYIDTYIYTLYIHFFHILTIWTILWNMDVSVHVLVLLLLLYVGIGRFVSKYVTRYYIKTSVSLQVLHCLKIRSKLLWNTVIQWHYYYRLWCIIIIDFHMLLLLYCLLRYTWNITTIAKRAISRLWI